jgi:hypothetical protein
MASNFRPNRRNIQSSFGLRGAKVTTIETEGSSPLNRGKIGSSGGTGSNDKNLKKN